jgi:hypothetical protein
MEFWVDNYLARLRQRNLDLAMADDLHPAWQCLTSWFLHRYQRIERVLRACQYDFVAFAEQYWPAVQQDLELQLARLEVDQPTSRAIAPSPATHLVHLDAATIALPNG